MLFRFSLIALGVSLLSTGCSSLYKGYSIRELTIDQDSNSQKLIKALKNSSPPLLQDKCLGEVAIQDDAACRQLRNQAIAVLVLSSEDACIEHRKSIYGNDASFNITTGTFTNLFAGWATVATAEQAKSVLSALALLSNSERSLVNETVYKTILVPAVDKKISQMRSEKASGLNANLTKNMAEYSYVRAFSDVIDFHYSCSFMTGLQRAIDEGVQETPKQKLARLDDFRRSIELELKSQCPAAALADPTTKTVCEAAVERHKAISDQIKVLQAQ